MSEPTNVTETNERATTFHWKKGIQSWFDVDGVTIEFWASGWNGKEEVRIDGELVSETRNLRRHSRHRFERADHQYEIHLECLALGTGTFRITLIRDGVEVDSDVGSYANQDVLGPDGRIDWKKAGKKMIPIFLISGLAGAICGYSLASWLL